jgi:hypothetical protein
MRRHTFPRVVAAALGCFVAGSGAGCEFDAVTLEAGTGWGARSGSLTISGHLEDGAGNAVVGARVVLDGDTDALRLSNFTGGFSFHVDPGSYRMTASGACSFAPAAVDFVNVAASVTHNFAATSVGCITSKPSNVVSNGRVLTLEPLRATTSVDVGIFSGADAAVARLDDILTEIPSPSARTRRLLIAGDTAIERLVPIDFAAPLIPAGSGVSSSGGTKLVLTTAIAAGDQVVRFETQLLSDAAPDTVDHFVLAGRSFTREQIPDLIAR